MLVPRLQEDRTLYIIVSATILFNAIGMEWLYKGLEQYTYITVRSILFKFIAVILMFILVRQKIRLCGIWRNYYICCIGVKYT